MSIKVFSNSKIKIQDLQSGYVCTLQPQLRPIGLELRLSSRVEVISLPLMLWLTMNRGTDKARIHNNMNVFISIWAIT